MFSIKALKNSNTINIKKAKRIFRKDLNNEKMDPHKHRTLIILQNDIKELAKSIGQNLEIKNTRCMDIPLKKYRKFDGCALSLQTNQKFAMDDFNLRTQFITSTFTQCVQAGNKTTDDCLNDARMSLRKARNQITTIIGKTYTLD